MVPKRNNHLDFQEGETMDFGKAIDLQSAALGLHQFW